MSYEIEDINMEQMGLEAAALNKETTAMDNFVKMPEKEGYVLLRLLPALKGKWHFCATRIHRLGEYPNSKTFHCLRQRVKTPKGFMWLNPSNNPKDDCPICQKYGELWKVANNQHGDEQIRTQNTARGIKPIERFYWNTIVRQQLNPKTNSMDTNVGPKVFSCGKTLQTIIIDSINGNQITGLKKLGNVLHPSEGRDFRLVKKIKKGNGGFEYPDYAQSSFEDISPLGTDAEIKSWLANLHDLDSFRVLLPREEIIAAMAEFFNGGNEKADWEDDSPKAAKAQPAAAKAATPAAKPAAKAAPKSEIEDLINLGMDDELQAALDKLG